MSRWPAPRAGRRSSHGRRAVRSPRRRREQRRHLQQHAVRRADRRGLAAHAPRAPRRRLLSEPARVPGDEGAGLRPFRVHRFVGGHVRPAAGRPLRRRQGRLSAWPTSSPSRAPRTGSSRTPCCHSATRAWCPRPSATRSTSRRPASCMRSSPSWWCRWSCSWPAAPASSPTTTSRPAPAASRASSSGSARAGSPSAGAEPTADDIAAHLAEVSATEPYTIPGSIFEEVFGVIRTQLGICRLGRAAASVLPEAGDEVGMLPPSGIEPVERPGSPAPIHSGAASTSRMSMRVPRAPPMPPAASSRARALP